MTMDGHMLQPKLALSLHENPDRAVRTAKDPSEMR